MSLQSGKAVPKKTSGPARAGWLAASLALVCVTQVVGVPPAAAQTYRPGQVWTPAHTADPKVAPVAGTRGDPKPRATGVKTIPQFTGRQITLPAAGTTTVVLPGGSAAKAGAAAGAATAPQAARVGSSPLYLAAGGSAKQTVSVRFAGQAVAQQAGVASGLLWAVSSAGGGPVRVQLDPSAFDGTAGGDFAQRLTLVQLPACALTTPTVAACQRSTPLTVTRDATTGRLSATVTTPATGAKTATATAGSMIVMAAQAAPAGSAGTYTATETKPSDEWSHGGATGGFDYSYPVTVPASLGGAVPPVNLAYDSQAVDGMTASTNAQSGWIGSGWNYQPGYIERSYQPCSDDGIANSNDTCWQWGGDEVSLNQAGMGGQLVNDDGTGHAWHLSGDPGATIQLLQNTGSVNNGAYKGEYWVITTQDGTRYYYGAGHLPAAEGGTGVDPASNSAWTQPVYCPKTGDPCYSSSTGTSSFATNMAYRWNLDYVVDPHGNTTVYTYQTETNYYARSSAHTLTKYVRGGVLTQVSYGWRASDVATQATPAPAVKIVFTTAQRCTGSQTECSSLSNLTSTTKLDWPDTPQDLICQSTGTCTNYSESYFSTLMLTKITTQVNTASGYKTADTYALDETFPDPGDGTTPSMWLSSIVHTGNDGTAVSLPAVTFGPVQLANRVPGSGTYPAYNHLRVADIVDETGGEIAVTYTNTTPSVAACDQTPGSSSLPTPSSDDRLCYQQYWQGPGQQNPTADWFEKYVITQVQQIDLVMPTTPAQITTYTYNGTPAWHRDDSVTTKNAQRSWNMFRGFGSVTTVTGTAPDPQTQQTTLYLRGMNGDYESQTGGTQRSVTVSDNLGDPAVTDANALADSVLETDTYSQAGGTVQDKSATLPLLVQTASHAETAQPGLPAELANFVNPGTTVTAELDAGGTWRSAKTVRVYSATTGLLSQTDTQGDQSLVGTAASQETCTKDTYATPPASGLNTGMVSLPARSYTVTVGTGGPIGTGSCPAPTAANTVSDTLTFYDGKTTSGAIGSVGNVTRQDIIDSYTGSTPNYVSNASAGTFDVYGRETGATDGRGLVTTTAFTPATGKLPTSIVDTNVTFSMSTSKTMDPLREMPTKTVDENGNATSEGYDGLGRLTSVWLPGRTVAQPASLAYVYIAAGATTPSAIETKTLRDDATYATSFTIYDGQGLAAQTQAVTLDGSNNSLVTDAFYDSHGWTVKATSQYEAAGLPSATLVQTADASVPGETVTAHDGRGRTTVSAFYSYGNKQWQSTTAYPGDDRTDVTPASGGTATSTFTDILGRTVADWSYTTPTPTGVASDARVISYTYNADGTKHSITGPTGQVWTYTYDLHGNLATTSDPDAGNSSSTYDPEGDLLNATDGNGQLITYTYDKLGRKTAEYTGTAISANLTAMWSYDSAPGGKGKLASSTSVVGGVSYVDAITGYTNRGSEAGTSITVPTNVPASQTKLIGTYSTSTAYNPISGTVSSITYNADGGLPAETVFNTYNQNGVLTNVGGTSSYLTSTTVDPFGRITRWTLGSMPNQVVQTSNYDVATSRVTEEFIDKESAPTHVDDISTLFDPDGQITAVSDVQDGTKTDLQCFTYNQLDQLTQAWSDNGGVTLAGNPSVPGIGSCQTTSPTAANIGGPAPYWQTFGYDLSGNRQTETDHDPAGITANDIVRAYHYNAVGSQPDRLQNESHTGPGAGTDSYTYNPNGQVAGRTIAGSPAQTITYTPDNLTSSVTDTSGNSANYTYDADGNLLLQTDVKAGATTVTLYLGSEQLTVSNNTVSGQRYYTTAGGPTVIRSSTGTVVYECGNSQSTFDLIISGDSTQAETRRWVTPYGATRGAVPGSWVDGRAYLDKPSDPVSGLDQLGLRNYDPGTGRFLQPDTMLEQHDPNQIGGYTYAADDPVNMQDPTGQWGWKSWLKAAVVVVAVVAVVAVVVACPAVLPALVDAAVAASTAAEAGAGAVGIAGAAAGSLAASAGVSGTVLAGTTIAGAAVATGASFFNNKIADAVGNVGGFFAGFGGGGRGGDDDPPPASAAGDDDPAPHPGYGPSRAPTTRGNVGRNPAYHGDVQSPTGDWTIDGQMAKANDALDSAIQQNQVTGVTQSMNRTWSAGVNIDTGQYVVMSSGDGYCAEGNVVNALGGDISRVKFVTAQQVTSRSPLMTKPKPPCSRCADEIQPDQIESVGVFAYRQMQRWGWRLWEEFE